MNREIKFRVWHRKDKRMYPVSGLCLEQGKAVLVSVFDGKHNRNQMPEWLEIMQYTGLKDKNGKDCFDCDVIRAKANPADTPRKSAVFWTNHGWQVNLKGTNRFLSDLGDFEIIGNIYQNPDLLPVSPDK